MALAAARSRFLFVLASLVGVAACESPLPAWERHAGGAGEATPADAFGEPRLAFDPPAPREAVTRVTRITVELGQALGTPRVLLVEGGLTSAQLRDLARPTVTQTLSARAHPALVWTSSDPALLIIAPLQPLAPGTLYTVGVSEPPVALPFTVATGDPVPLLPRVWPDPADLALPGQRAVWCGSDTLADVDVALTLAPSKTPGRLARGTGATVVAPQCVSWFPQPETVPTPMAPPVPAVTPASVVFANGATTLLEPALLWPGSPVLEPTSAACEATEVRFGPGCATVGDDRIVVRPPGESILWTIDDGQRSIVRRSRSGQSFVVRPLPADRLYRLAALDEGGRLVEGDLRVNPEPPRPHVVLNEVMANPAGVERDQEWVELVNDGLLPVALGGYGLETGGGTAILPVGVLEPGAFALVVTDGYVADDGVDPVAAPGTLVLRVPALGRDGLSNEGERLVLRDAAGAAVSTFPAMKAKSGVSNARIAPDAPDGNADSFTPSANGGATPGAPNVAP